MSKIISINHCQKSHEKFFIISWNLGNICNYKCSYCPELLHAGDVSFPNKVLIISTLKYLKNQIPKDRKLYVEFTGGEVTLHPEFKAVISALNTLDIKVGIITNGSKPESFWKDIAPKLNHICISYHHEFAREAHFSKVINILSEHTTTHVNIMAPKEGVEGAMKFLTNLSLNNENITIELQPIILHEIETSRELDTYKDDDLRRLRDFKTPKINSTKDPFTTRGDMLVTHEDKSTKQYSAAQIITNKLNVFKGFNCFIGLETLIIDYRGYVFRGKCNVGGPLGHITKRPLTIPTTPIVCNRNHCHCNFDLTVTKEMSEN